MPYTRRFVPQASRWTRLSLAAAILAASTLMTGCPPPAKNGPGGLTSQQLDAPIVGSEPVAGGAYLSVGVTSPLAGDALTKARLSRAQVLSATAAKAAPDLVAATAPAAQPAEPPPLAVKYYLQGRECFLEGANTEAMDFLEKALQLDPQAFTVLRLMGRVCFAASQLPRGSMYLQRARLIRPEDVETNYLLGRYWLERKDFDRAVYFLIQADDSPLRAPTSAQAPLVCFYLGRALQAGGYHLAATGEFTRFLDQISVPAPGYRYDRELSYLIDESWAAHLAAAENAVAAGDFAGALPHYHAAAAQQPRDLFIASRLVNALVHTGHLDAARAACLELLTATHGADDALKLTAWTYRLAGRQSELLAELSARIRPTSGDDPAPAIVLAATQDYLGQPAAAFATLDAYQRQHPSNLDVLARLAKRVNSADTFLAALSAAARALQPDGSNSDQILKLLTPLAASPFAAAALQAAPSGKLTFADRYLRAVAGLQQNLPFAAVDTEFHAAVTLAPAFFPARSAYISWLLAQEKFPQAAELVQQVAGDPHAAGTDGPHALQLQIECEAAQQRLSSALKLALDARRQFPNIPEIRMELAAIYRLREQFKEADAELSSLIDEQPAYEPAYRQLINSLYFRQRIGDLSVSDALNAAAGAVARLRKALPDSRFGQTSAATVLARAGRYDEAETILRNLLSDDPNDADILIPLAQIREILTHHTEAVATLENTLQTKPQPELVRALASLYHDQEKPADALALTQRMMEQNPDSEAYLLIYAAELTAQNKQPAAISFLTAARKKFPRSQALAAALARDLDLTNDHQGAVRTLQEFIKANGETTERLYLLAHYDSALGNDDASVSALQRVLAIMPDHIGANNDLGYFWVDAGINLDQAERMITKALDNQPANAAFLDSLGWLNYKRGRFTDAITLLQRSIAQPGGRIPEVLQHLGDALYRAGRLPEAVEQWHQALGMLGAVSSGLTKTDQRVKDYLTRVTTTAATNASRLDVSPIVSRDAPQSAGPTTMPANPPR